MAFIEPEKALIVAKYIRPGSVTTTHRWFQTRMQKTALERNTIIYWHDLLIENGNLGRRWGNGRPRTSEVTVEQVRLKIENQHRPSVRASVSLNRSLIQTCTAC